VEAYVVAAAPLLADGAPLVLCGDARANARVAQAASGVGLSIVARTDVVARTGQPALFSVWTLRERASELDERRLTLRGPSGEPTADARRLRAFSGFAVQDE
jgi:hypothetical protein